MANLSAKELTAIEDMLTMEETMVKKFKLYAQACTDPALKQKCEEVAAKHQNHFCTLMGMLG